MGHLHDVTDTESAFIINPIAKTVTGGPKTLIQRDHASERITFEVPRYIDSHDVMDCNVIEVHYDNVDSKTGEKSQGYHVVTDKKVVGSYDDKVQFTWLIDALATKHIGAVEFSVRFACVNDSIVNYQWFTAVCSCIKVQAGVFNSDASSDTSMLDEALTYITMRDILKDKTYRLYVLDGDLMVEEAV